MSKNNPIVVSLEITDQVLCDGVTFAMNLRNAGLPVEVQAKNEDGSPKVDEDGHPVMIANPERIESESDYVRFVGTQTVKSYAQQKVRADFDEGLISKAQRDAALAALA